MTITPANVDLGQRFTVVMTVTNTGQGNANNVGPNSLNLLASLSGTASATFISQPAPTQVSPFVPGQVQSFTWVYQAASVGFLAFSDYASGVDALLSNSISSTAQISNFINVETAGSLLTTLTLSATTAGNGQHFNVVMGLTNTGGGAVTSINPPLALNVSGSAASVTLITSPSSLSLSAGAIANLTWVYAGTATPGPPQLQRRGLGC